MAVLEEKLAARRQARLGESPEVGSILAILAALLPLLFQCLKPTPATLRLLAGSRLSRRRAVIQLRRDNRDLSRDEAEEQAVDAQQALMEMSDDELRLLIDDCFQ